MLADGRDACLGASWAMPEHASSMARPTADDILMVHDDEEVGVVERHCDAAGTLPHAARCGHSG